MIGDLLRPKIKNITYKILTVVAVCSFNRKKPLSNSISFTKRVEPYLLPSASNLPYMFIPPRYLEVWVCLHDLRVVDRNCLVHSFSLIYCSLMETANNLIIGTHYLSS